MENTAFAYTYNGNGRWLDCDRADYMDYWCGNSCGPVKGISSPRSPSYIPSYTWNAAYAGMAGVGEYPYPVNPDTGKHRN